MSLFEQAAALSFDLFDYNRKNFRYDREQRLISEYQVAEMRVQQASLWRRDVRDFCGLTPRKMEVYLLIIALELGFCVMALCKARVPPGAPPWLVACHTLAVVGALMYLFLALWFGMHAFVSSQAYKVRILTQLVRLPVPTWSSLESSRTYSSAFEKMPAGQMLRVPFAAGVQERQAQAHNAQDPWGLERRGDDISELDPDVNGSEVERQRHVWLVREAARFYQTYDAFCRISMSAGTSCLAIFLCYHCMTHVMSEIAAPLGAWCGMIVFISCALVLIRSDLQLSGPEYATQFSLVMAGPVLSFIVTYHTGRNQGHPGPYKFLVCAAAFFHGFALFHTLVLFRVREMQTGAVLPTAFRHVLFIDPFGWAKHSGAWWRSFAQSSPSSGVSGETSAQPAAQPAMQCVAAESPRRPEDVDSLSSRRSGDVQAGGDLRDAPAAEVSAASFRPSTFSRHDIGQDDLGAQTGTDIHGENPGLVPWRVYFVITVFLALCWWAAAGIALLRSVTDTGVFASYKTAKYGSFGPGQVLPIPELVAVKVETSWNTPMVLPKGLACDPGGRWFLAAGRAANGGHALLQARLDDLQGAGPTLRFREAPACQELQADGRRIQDMTLMGCRQQGDNCSAAILLEQGERLVSCSLRANTEAYDGQPFAVPLGRAWLHDRGSQPLRDELREEEGLPQAEDMSALVAVPCAAGGLFQVGDECLAIGTTSRRLAQLALADNSGSGPWWVPRRLLRKDHVEVPRPGTLGLHAGRYLAALYPDDSEILFMDLERGGSPAGAWRLPRPRGGGGWASICGGAGAIFALEDGESPSVWRFEARGADRTAGVHRAPPRSA